MANRQNTQELRLEIALEAEALMSALGMGAYGAARRRAYEASSDAMARDWSVVAETIARRTGMRATLQFATLQ
jgi:hypothetical protein